MDRFIIMTEWADALDHLTDEQVGKFFRIMTNYSKGVEVEINDQAVQVAWNLIKPQVKRINDKYQTSIENGKKGGRPKNNLNQPNNNPRKPNNNPTITQENPTETYKDKDKEKEKYKEIISSYGDFDERFTKIVNLFPSSKQNGVDDAYHYTWQFLDEEEKRTAEKMSAIYIERNQTTQNYIKSVGKYFEERFWNIDKVSLDFIKNKNNSGKTYQQRVSEVIV